MIASHEHGSGGPPPKGNRPLDSANHFAVVRELNGDVAFHPFASTQRCRMTAEQALNLSVWLFTMSGAHVSEFARLSQEIKK